MNRAVQFDPLPERAETQRGLVAVAMSGGVDSSAVAALLQQQGRAVVGLTMQLWNQRRLPELQGDGPARHRCCSLDDVYDAKAVAQHLNSPHYVVNFEEQFEARVVRPFVDQYLAGRTPIACTNCNTDVKFEPLLRMARQIGAERLATGHYARIRRNDQTGRWELLRARDESRTGPWFRRARAAIPSGRFDRSCEFARSDRWQDARRRSGAPCARAAQTSRPYCNWCRRWACGQRDTGPRRDAQRALQIAPRSSPRNAENSDVAPRPWRRRRHRESSSGAARGRRPGVRGGGAGSRAAWSGRRRRVPAAARRRRHRRSRHGQT